MDWFLRICGLCGLASALVLLVRRRKSVRGTTLTAAANWSIVSLAVWMIVWSADVLFSLLPAGLADRFYYAAAVLALAPPVTVLGSRRPTSRVWQWFVVLPLLVVLGLPLAAFWPDSPNPSRLELETPVLVGYFLVLLMSAGNYVGTRQTLPALCFAAAAGLLAASVAAALPEGWPSDDHLRSWATILLVVAILLACRREKSSASGEAAVSDRLAAVDRLWTDFRNTFGIVWARRIQDRVNAAAEKEQWPARLETAGFVWLNRDAAAGNAELPEDGLQSAVKRVEQTLRWLLRRFCDPEWIDERLGSNHID